MLTKIEAAKKISLDIVNGKTNVEAANENEKRAMQIAEQIAKVPNICSSGRRSIGQIFNILIAATCSDKIAEIKDEYFEASEEKDFFEPFTVIVPTRDSIGFKKGKPILVLDNSINLMRATGSVADAGFSSHRGNMIISYRSATKEEVESFYAMLFASVEFDGKLSSKLKIPTK